MILTNLTDKEKQLLLEVADTIDNAGFGNDKPILSKTRRAWEDKATKLLRQIAGAPMEATP